jgi:hypothetical protein
VQTEFTLGKKKYEMKVGSKRKRASVADQEDDSEAESLK